MIDIIRYIGNDLWRTIENLKDVINNMNSYKHELCRITKIFLDSEDKYDELFHAADAYYKLLLKASGLEPEKSSNREAIYLPTGKAIGSVWAALCIKEFMRTKRFVAGIYKAVKTAQERFPDTRLHVLYAGTGPFASLILPLTTAFSSSEICFTLLEINPNSIESLMEIIKTFEIDDYVKEIVCCDATEYKSDARFPIHIIISETMLNALRREPQVAITLNLAPQLVDQGIFIPENIKVEAGLLNNKRFQERLNGINLSVEDHYFMIKKIFQLDKDTYKLNTEYKQKNNNCYIFPKERIELPLDISNDYNQLCLFTTIQVFEDEYLTHWQCSLTLPQKILNLLQQEKRVAQIDFEYIISNNPGFKHTVY